MVGQTVLHYEILEELGKGGMGEVYKAKDTKLDRFVALKFLPTQITSTVDEKARFIQEAKAASSMNHPNVCTIHDIQELDGQLFIVMEFVDGITLRENKQRLSEKRIIEIAAQIADGLGAAHEKGIVHRDIKPENIMLRKDGIVQIMDFGLAKLYTSGNVSRLTKAGTTMGTMGYMSPEQVQGLEVDHRTDIFSLGVVLYEMFAGESPFKGIHETAIMYEIVNVDPPPVSTVKPEIDPALDEIISECLEKDKDERCQSAKELARNLRKLKRGHSGSRTSRIYDVNSQSYKTVSKATANFNPQKTSLGEIQVKNLFRNFLYNPKIFWSAAAVLFVAVILLLFFKGSSKSENELQEIKATILPPHSVNYDNNLGSNLAISPDGKYIAFIGTDSTGTSKLWIRPTNSLIARPLTNANNNAYPFWSPDSKTIAYFDKSKLMKISLDAGTSLPICDINDGRGGSWSSDGTIILSPNPTGGIYKVPSSGGKIDEIIKSDTTNQNQSLRWSYFLPDGDHFLYSTENSSTGSSSPDGIFLSSISDNKSQKLISASSNCQYANGFLLFVRQSILLAQKFDPDKLKIEGEAMPVTENIQYYDIRLSGTFSVSQNGKLIYLNASQNDERTVLLDKNGNEIKNLFNQKPMYSAVFSPNGNKIAYDLYDVGEKNIDIWTLDLNRNVSTRLTFNKEGDIVPIWTKDEKQILYSSSIINGVFDGYIKNADGSGDAQLIFKSAYTKAAVDISADGKYILFMAINSANNKSGWDIVLLNEAGDKKPVELLASNFNEQFATFSPDMKWIAYTSDESGKEQLYIIPFNPDNPAKLSGKWQISEDGGTLPKWTNGGKTIYFVAHENNIMAVEVNEINSSLSPGKPYIIFKPGSVNVSHLYDMKENLSEIIAAVPNGQKLQTPITLVDNWFLELADKNER
ncbi:MAG TPA: protein kinase [Ignavibacteriaceae bacterium]|nr:protein kinase [Ignavibacteriaceae bacterium]